MSILLFVFSAIFFGSMSIMNASVRQVAENFINSIYKDFKFYSGSRNEQEGEYYKQADGKVYEIDENGNIEYQEGDLLISSISPNSYYVAKLYRSGNVYFKIISDGGKNFLVVSDLSPTLKIFRLNSVKVLLVLITVYILLFVVVCSLSYRVFKPVKETFDKQKQFISNASHELKTPLTIISANADVLNEELKDNKWVCSIKSQTVRMNSLIADMLSLAKMDENTITLSREKFNLSDVVNESVLPFDAVAFEKKKTLTLEIFNNLEIIGDKSSAAKVTTILTDNAVKYAEGDGVIKISLFEESGKAVLNVYNSGSTVEEKDSQRIFERFYRGDSSRSRETGGSGLGLAIAKSICDANKWKISAKSQKGKFMEITVIFG